MGLAAVVEKAEASKTATPQTATPAPAVKGDKKQGKNTSYAQFKATGNAIRKAKSEEEKALEGSKSNTIAFVGCLGNPAKPQSRKQNNENIDSLTVVGYKLKALEDIEKVPVAKLKLHGKNPLDTEEVTYKSVKAGEEFDVNFMELAYLAGQPEYAGRFTGNGKAVVLHAKFSGDRPDPLPVLKLETAKGSIKEVMYEIADNIGDDKKKEWKVKDEYADKYDVLFVKKSSGKPGTSSTSKKETSADIAAAFLNYLNNRKTN